MTNRFWSLLTYRLPAKVDLARIDTMGSEHCHDSCPLMPLDTPKNQLLDKIIASEYCRPLTLHDLAYFCEEIEFSGENLQFHLDFLAYVKRWNALSEEEKEASPPVVERSLRPRLKRSELEQCVQGGLKNDESKDVIVTVEEARFSNAFSFVSSMRDSIVEDDGAVVAKGHTQRSGSMDSEMTMLDVATHTLKETDTATATVREETLAAVTESSRIAESIRAELNIDWNPAKNLPLRRELEEMISKYLLSSSARQLNLGYAMLLRCMTALGQTSHPSAMQPVADHIRHLLTSGTLPSFLRLSANNANTPRKWSSLIFSVATLIVVFSLTLLNIVQRKPVAMRAIGIPCLWFGMTCLLASLRGSCFLLFLRHRVQARPYEPPFQAVAAQNGSIALDSPSTAPQHHGEESWMTRWKRKSLWRRLMDQTHPTTGPYRDMQDAIMLQSLVGGLVVTIFISVFVGLIPVLD